MNGLCANHSARRICEKWYMRACGLAAKIYARPVGFFFFSWTAKAQLILAIVLLSKQYVFGFHFWMDFLCFGLWKRRQNRAIFILLLKTPILQKSLFSRSKIAIFLIRRLEKSTKIGCSKAMKNNVKKKASKIEFGSPFGPPKSGKIGPKSDVKPSLFRDAMGISRNSSQINGRHNL